MIMNADTKRYKVTILGEIYSLISDEAEELVLQAAQIVDERMANIADKLQLHDEKKVSVLAALQLASELLRLEAEHEKQSLKNQALADLIEQVVATSSSSTCSVE